MHIFHSIKELDYNGKEWSPQVTTICPHCTATMSFYTQLLNNQCKTCFKLLPFPSGMAKSEALRVKYHVESEAGGKINEQTDAHPMLMREGD